MKNPFKLLLSFLALPVIVGTLPYSIANGSPRDAVPVMGNFNWLVSQVNANAAGLSVTNTFTQPQVASPASAGIHLITAMQVQNNSVAWGGTAGGTANALTISPAIPATSYAAGQKFLFKSGATPNSGATTIAVSGLSTIAVQVNGSACTGGEIAANRWYQVVVDGSGTSCQLSKIGRATLAELGAAASGANTDITSLASGVAVTTQAVGDSSTKIASTAFVQSSTLTSKLPTITAVQAGGAITVGASAVALDFRSTTLTDGTITTVGGASADLVIPSGATLGVATTQSGRIVVVEMNNAGTKEKAVINLSGGNDLSETGVISTTAISGSSTAANVFYSTTGRSNLAYRVIGIFDAVNTAGAWGSPTLIQGAGGQAITAMGSIGYGQTWSTQTRTSGTTYYNTTGRPIMLKCDVVASASGMSVAISINGSAMGNIVQQQLSVGSPQCNGTIIIPAGASYALTDTNVSTRTNYELR